MNEEQYKRWDIIIKIGTPFVTIFGLLVGIWQFNKEQAAQLQRQNIQISQNSKLEFERRKWERQLEIYLKLSSVVGKIATINQDNKKLLQVIDDFYSLYWGETILFEDKSVEAAMKTFHLEIQDFLKGRITKDRLKVRASELNTALRESYSKNRFEN